MTAGSETLRPFRHPMRWARIGALGAFVVPICAAALLLGIDDHRPAPAVVLLGVAAAACLALVLLTLAVRIDLRPDGLRSRRWIGFRQVPSATVDRVVLRRIQNADEVTSHRHLFLADAAGRTVLRMSDRWWTEAQMARVAGHFAVPVEAHEATVYLPELRRTARASLSPTERHPWAWAAARALVVAGVGLGIAALTVPTL